MNTTDTHFTHSDHQETVDLADVRRLAYRIARQVTDRVDPDDLAQEALERYWLRFGTTGRPDHLHAWVRQVVCRLSIDHDRRARGRNLDRPAATGLELSDRTMRRNPALMAPSPSRQIISEELLERALAPLSPRDRQVFELRMGGGPARTVAARLGMTAAAVDQAYGRAKASLAAALRADHQLKADLRDTPSMICSFRTSTTESRS